MIVHAEDPVTLVGGAKTSTVAVKKALSLAPRLVAADGGAGACLRAGVQPEAVIGDLDSLRPADRARLADRLVHIPEQETTDFDKALRQIAAPLVLALGFSGGRLDHELAAIATLLARSERAVILIGPQTLSFLCPPRLTLDLPRGALVSLFPMLPLSVESSGLQWPTAGLTLAPAGRIGTSNAAQGAITLIPSAPGLLVILRTRHLPVAMAALLASGRWPPAALAG